MTYDEAYNLAQAVLENAIRDAEGRIEGNQTHAVAWLASKDAQIWLDLLGLEQSAVLMAIDWPSMALKALQGSPTASEARTITTTLDHFASLSERITV